jgi:hypothetical protein
MTGLLPEHIGEADSVGTVGRAFTVTDTAVRAELTQFVVVFFAST